MACPKCQTAFVVPRAEPVNPLAQAAANSDEARLFEGIDMSRVLAASRADAKVRAETNRPCRACETPLAPTDDMCPGCGALIQGRASVRADFPQPQPGTSAGTQKTRGGFSGQRKGKLPPCQKRTQASRKGDGETSKVAMVLGAIFMVLAVLALINGITAKGRPPGMHVDQATKAGECYGRYVAPFVMFLVGYTLWRRAYEPRNSFFRGLAVYCGSGMLYGGIAMLITLVCYVGIPKQQEILLFLLCVFGGSIVLGYFLLAFGFRPRLYTRAEIEG